VYLDSKKGKKKKERKKKKKKGNLWREYKWWLVQNCWLIPFQSASCETGIGFRVGSWVGLGRVVRKVRQHPEDHEFESQWWQ
jgi:hypothetical protein